MATTQSTVIELTASDKTQAAFGNAQRSLDKLKATAAGFSAALGPLGAALGGGAFVAFAKTAIDTADNLNDLALKTQSSVGALASLKLISEQSGTSLEEVGKGINKLTLWMAENGQAAKKLGIDAQDPVEAFIQFAGALERTESPRAKAALANKILGKSYADLMPLLAEGSDGIARAAEASREYAHRMELLAPAADKFNDQLARLKQAADLAAASLVNPLLPSLTETATRMAELAEKGGPALAVLRGFAGLGKLPFDAILGDSSLSNLDGSVEGSMKALRQKLSDLTRHRKDAEGQGLLHEWLYGSKADLDREIEVTRNQLAALQKYQDKLRPPAAPGVKPKASALLTDSGAASKPKLDVIDPFYSARTAAEKAQQDEINRFMAAQQDDINALNSALAEDTRKAADEAARALEGLLSNTTLARTEAFMKDVEILNQAFYDGAIGVSQYDEAMAQLTTASDKAAGSLKSARSFADDFGESIADTFERGIISGKKFGDVLKDLDGLIAQMIIREAVTKPLGQAISGAFAGGFGNGQNLLGDFASLFGFASGGSFTVGGSGGTDSQVVAFKATPGEMVDVRTPGQQAGGVTVHVSNTYHIDSRTDRASIVAMMEATRSKTEASILTSLQRGGTFARATGRA